MAELRIPVDGMTCGGCTSSVERALGRLDGVQGASASVQEAAVVVQFDGARVDRARLVAAIEAAGYDVPQRDA